MLGVQVVKDNRMSGRFQRLHCRRGDRVAKASLFLMADQDEDVHGGEGLGTGGRGQGAEENKDRGTFGREACCTLTCVSDP